MGRRSGRLSRGRHSAAARLNQGRRTRSGQIVHSISSRATARDKSRSRGRNRWRKTLTKQWANIQRAIARGGASGRAMGSQRARLGKVGPADARGNPRVQRDGEEMSKKGYGRVQSYSAANPPAAGDRVLMQRHGKQDLIVGKVIQN